MKTSSTDNLRRTSYRAIETELSERIGSGEWSPGSLIPNETELAESFACSRATVNRALQEMARRGLVVRKRRAGTRVAVDPIQPLRLEIPLVRQEVESSGRSYQYRLLSRELCAPSELVGARLGVGTTCEMLHVRSLHLADHCPYQFEDRWIHSQAIPAVLEQSFATISPNEWLVKNCPLSKGQLHFFAAKANAEEAELLQIPPLEPIFVGERLTWLRAQAITLVRMIHPASHRVSIAIE